MITNGGEFALDLVGVGSVVKTAKAVNSINKQTRLYQKAIRANTTLTKDQKLKQLLMLKFNQQRELNKARKLNYIIQGANAVPNIYHTKDIFQNPFNNSNIQPNVVVNDNTRVVKRRSLKD